MTECSICLDDYGGERRIASIPCGHVFHHDCLQTATEATGRSPCPICRVEFSRSKILKLYLEFKEEDKTAEKRALDQLKEAKASLWRKHNRERTYLKRIKELEKERSALEEKSLIIEFDRAHDYTMVAIRDERAKGSPRKASGSRHLVSPYLKLHDRAQILR